MDDGSWSPGSGIMFAVPDAKAAVAQFRAKGVKIEGDVMEMHTCNMAFAEDSEGNTFILHERKA